MRGRALVIAGVAALALAGPARAEPILGQPGTFTCGDGLSFPQSAFRNPTGSERGGDPPSDALRRFLRSDPEGELPARGWRVLARTPKVVEFHADDPPDDEGHGVDATARLSGDKWRIEGWGTCLSSRVVPGFEAAPISSGPPAAVKLDARRRSIRLWIDTGTCSPGDDESDPQRRFERAEVLETGHTVTVLILLRPEPPPSSGVCGGVGLSFPHVFRLARPLGHRAVRDGNRFPPRFVGRGRDL